MSVATESRHGDWIETFSGVRFYPFDPRPGEILLEDVAKGLSNTCRFTGQIREFYSVAEHSVLCSRLVPPEDALWALLHDASEAYLSDIARPVKRHPGMLAYREAESRLMGAICTRFGLSREMPPSVHKADNALLASEAQHLLPNFSSDAWASLQKIIPANVFISCLSPREAEQVFLLRYHELTRDAQ